MTQERFAEILREYDFSDKQIQMLWEARPSNDLDEKQLRKTAEHIAPIKDRLIQA